MMLQMNHIHRPYEQNDFKGTILLVMKFDGEVQCKYDEDIYSPRVRVLKDCSRFFLKNKYSIQKRQ